MDGFQLGARSMIGDLPSAEHAAEFLAAPNATSSGRLLVDVIGRAFLIAVGMELFGRRARSNFGRALAGSAMIELFVLGFTLRKVPAP